MKTKENNRKRNNLIKCMMFIVGVALIIGCSLKPLLKDLKFGLDLQGGFEILYQVEGANGEEVTDSMVTNTYKTIEKRINGLGVSESEISVEGKRIRVQLPGIKDGASARETLSAVANLTFRDSNDNLLMTSNVLSSGGAKVSVDEMGRPAVALSIKDKDTFYAVTNAISLTEDKLIVIWLDYQDGVDSYASTVTVNVDGSQISNCGTQSSRCLSAATVSQGFASDVIIQGSFSPEEVENLVTLINSGSLPTKLTEISSKTVSAQFGSNSLELTAIAGAIGIAIIMALMVLIYHFAGFVASIGILIYAFLTVLTFWLFGGVLTLPGIAALVIGIGMAVDSSVITFARIKEELKENVTLEGACRKGNEHSFMAIFDGNFTTLLVAFILFIFGESSVKGFATMLIISTIVTMLIMVFLTRTLLKLFVQTGMFDKHLNLFIGYKESKKEKKNIKFIKMRKFAYIYVVLMIVLGAYTFITNGLTLGIDFKGGSSIAVTSNKVLDEKVLKAELEELKYNVYDVEVIDKNNITFKVKESFGEEEVIKIEKIFTEKHEATTDIGVVSNVVKKDLVKNAIMSVIIACVGIVLYVSFRFKFSYAISAIFALAHDAAIIFVIFSLLKLEVSSIFIAAILSIIGYSINDTIVTFDRIRENIKNTKKGIVKDKEELKEIIDRSLTQTIGRSVFTTLTTLSPVVMLIVKGSHEIFNFNFALLIGLIAGVLSSIFLAAQLLFDIEKRQIGKPKKKKWYEDEEPKEKKIKGINA